MPVFLLACLTYLASALPQSTLGLIWPSMRLTFHQPAGALGALLVFGVIASVISSVSAGRVLDRAGTGPVLAVGAVLSAVALAAEVLAPSLWLVGVGILVSGLGFGAIDAALNAYAAHWFGARTITWMHASYGLGATIGPALITALLASGLGWRRSYGVLAIGLAAVAVLLTATRRSWQRLPVTAAASATGAVPAEPAVATAVAPAGHPGVQASRRPAVRRQRRLAAATLTGSLIFTVAETGIESGAGIWGYLYLIDGRGLPHAVAGLAVSAYWAMMFAGRAVLGAVAGRVGPSRVLAGAVTGVAAGAALMTMPGPRFLAVLGLMVLGLAAAPIFPLFTLTIAGRTGAGAARTTQTVSWQVAASAAGGAALPAALGLVVALGGPVAVAPALLGLSLLMCGLYAVLASRRAVATLAANGGR